MVSRDFNVALQADVVCYESLLAINHLDVCSNGELYHLLGDRKRREEQQQFVLEDPISITLLFSSGEGKELLRRGRKIFQQFGLNAVIMYPRRNHATWCRKRVEVSSDAYQAFFPSLPGRERVTSI
jgi:hypothetical protein